ncbi:MAG: hypothetical protein H7Y37_00235 [Anaerolineae bacterium]|nr:hypothetical protein [Gloeobacterales cyanobacterium ES-bin-313]
MSTNIELNPIQPPHFWTQKGFYAITVCFNLCLVAQVLSVGIAYFYAPEWWAIHVGLVRAYSGLTLILLIWVFAIPFPKRIRLLTVSLPILVSLQFLTIHLKINLPLAALHPLIGFTLFSASTNLVHRTRRIAYPKSGAED